MPKIQYVRVILTEKCNLKCFFCHKEGMDNKEKSVLSKKELMKCLQVLYDTGIRKFKFMGGEPTLFSGLEDIIKRLKEIDRNLDISMISNGTAPKEVYEEYIKAGIDRVNISLHGFDECTFTRVTKGNSKQLTQVIETIKYLRDSGKLGKVNYVLLKGENEDEFRNVIEFANREKIVLDVLNYLGMNDDEINQYRYSFDEIVSIINNDFQIENIATHENMYSLNSKRLVLCGGGIINLKVNQLNEMDFLEACRSCNNKKYCIEGISAIRLTTDGIVKPCLFRDDLLYDMRSEINRLKIDEVVEHIQEYFEKL